MFDVRVRRWIDPSIEAVASRLARMGATPNGLTMAGFIIGCAAALSIVAGALFTAFVLIIISRLCDGLDGAVARHNSSQSDFGGYLDIVLDFAFYGMIPLAFIVADPAANSLAGGVLLLTFYVNGASFLAYALMAEKRGLSDLDRGSKSLLYTTGLAEATETIGVFLVFCLFPDWFPVVAWCFAAVVALTTTSRILLARTAFREM